MADQLVRGPNNTIIRYADQGDGTWAEVVSAVGSVGGAGLVDGDYGDVTVGGTGTTMTIDNGAVTLAKMANIATDSFIGRDTAGTGVPEVLSATTARSILGITTGSGTGGLTVLPISDKATVTVGGANIKAGRFLIPANVLGTRGWGRVRCSLQKSGATDAGTMAIKCGTQGQLFSAQTQLQAANLTAGFRGMVLEFWFRANGTTKATILCENSSGSIATITAPSIGAFVTATIDTSSAWEISIGGGMSGTTDTWAILDALCDIIDPDATGGSGVSAYADLTDLPEDDPDLVSYVNPAYPAADAAARAVVAADHLIEYSGAATGAFTLAAGVTFERGQCLFVQANTGSITLTVPAGVTLNGVDGSVTPTITLTNVQWSTALLIRRSANNYLVA
jgi:hypothetical protein